MWLLIFLLVGSLNLALADDHFIIEGDRIVSLVNATGEDGLPVKIRASFKMDDQKTSNRLSVLQVQIKKLQEEVDQLKSLQNTIKQGG